MTESKLWLLRPVECSPEDDPWEPWFDKAFGFVVRAETEEKARKLANESGGDEIGEIRHSAYRTGGNPWLDEKYSTCTILYTYGEEGVVIRDFMAA